MLVLKCRRFSAALLFLPLLLLLIAFPLHAQSSFAAKSSGQSSQSANASQAQSREAPQSRQPTEALSPRARDEAEIRSEQRFVEPDPPKLQFSVINSETPKTNGKTSDCTPAGTRCRDGLYKLRFDFHSQR
jgi:hypothetical protein